MADFTVTTDIDTFMQSADKAAMRTNMDLGTAATKNVAATGDAASGEVVKGDDTRLTDARTPTSHTHTASEVTDFDSEVANNTTVAANTSKLAGIEAGAEVNNISDVNATDLTDGGDSTLHYHSADRARANHTGTQTLSTISDAGTAASKDVPATGDAGAGEVVLGNDTRLTDARTPTAHTHTASEITDFDTEVSNNTTVAANTSKLSGIEAGAEVNNISDVNATDLTDGGDSSLHYHSADRNRANHTGTQTLSTISDAGTIASQNANSVNITGGSVTGITDLAIADGGTGAGTASGARTNLDVYSTGEVDEYLAPKATAGGVRFDGANGYFDLSQNYTAFQQKDRVLTYAFNLKAEQQTFRQYIYFTGHDISNLSSGVQIYINENSDEIRFILRQPNAYASHYLVRFDGVIDGNDNHFVFSLDYTGTDPVITGFKNGQSLSGSVVVSKTGTFDDSIAARDTVAFSNDLDGTIRDAAIFNRALTATEVADLYRNGLAGIADADRWGGLTYSSDFSATTDGFASGGGSNLVLTGNIDAISGVDDTLRLSTLADVSCLITKSSGVQMESGYYYEVEFDYYADSGSGLAYWGLGGPSGTRFDTDGGAAVVEGSWQTVKLKGLIQSTLRTIAAFTTSTGTSLDALLSGKNVYFKNITFTKLGAIAAYPMDEGIGYQLHDISSNHYDGLLSTSGFTHLVPKTEGYIRDFGVDAYNGGSGNVNLVDSTRDILPDRYTLSTIILRNGNAAGVTGTLDIKVDGSSPLTIHSASIALDGVADVYSLYLALDQNTPYRNNNSRKRVALTASDSDATNLDVRVDYKVN